jgi:hypothetical protein
LEGVVRSLKLWLSISLVVLVASGVALVAAPGVALADTWSDITDAQWQSTYGVTAAQVDTVADGFTDGTFRPGAMVTRGQFAKMSVLGLGVSPLTPATPSFTDVGTSNTFYSYIEGAAAAELVQGLGDGRFGPGQQITREQAATILARYLAGVELDQEGFIAGSNGAGYSSLTAWYAAEGSEQLAAFSDHGSVMSVHRPGMAYLVARGVIHGTNGKLNPSSSITRAQSAVMILRTAQVAGTFGAHGDETPTVTLISPTSGSAGGGDVVTITGTNFTAGAIVTFGSTAVASTNVTVNSSSQITVVSPPGTAGATVQVKVTTDQGTSADTSAANFTYVGGAPAISSLSLGAGNPAGGDTVVITGSGFTAGAQVYFGSTQVAAAAVTVTSATSITVVSPAGTSGSTVRVMVVTSGGTSPDTMADNFSYGLPTVTGVSPAGGAIAGGYTVTITGTGFSGSLVVRFGSTAVAAGLVNIISPTQLSVTAPAGTNGQMVDVTVANSYGTSAITTADKFSYGGPSITALTPAAGNPSGGNTVVITGTNFTSASQVYFGTTLLDSANVTVNSSTQITVVSPAGAAGTSVAVYVSTVAGTNPTTTANYFSFGAPVVTSVTPSTGDPDGGDAVTIIGAGFTGQVTVYFNGVALDAGDVTLANYGEIDVISPAGVDGTTVGVTVANDYGTSTDTILDRFTYAETGPPTITSINPTTGSADGGDLVAITGTNFTPLSTVAVDGVVVTPGNVTVVNATSIIFVMPAGTAGDTVAVTVTTGLGTSNSAGFTYEEET